MEEEKLLNKKIYQLQQETWMQQERLKGTLQEGTYDQPMNKRRADSDGKTEQKKSKSQESRGREAYNSPTNGHLANMIPNWGWNVYGDEVGTIGSITQSNMHAQKGKNGEKGKGGKTKGKGKKEGGTIGAKAFFPAPDHEGPLVKMQMQIEICKLKTERRIVMEVPKDWFQAILDIILKEKVF